jgi:hypothetical protein
VDEELREPSRVTSRLAGVVAGLLVAAIVSVGVVARDNASDQRIVTAAGRDADGVSVPTTVRDLAPPLETTTIPPTTAAPTTTTTAPKPTTTQPPRPTTTTTKAPVATTTPTTAVAQIKVTLVNSSPSAVTLVLNGKTYKLAPGQQIGPVVTTHDEHGNDTISLTLDAVPTCGVGDADSYFPKPGNYRLTVETSPGTCIPPSGRIDSVQFRVTPA